MKKLLSMLLIACVCLTVVFSFTACSDPSLENSGGGNTDATATPLPEDIDPATVDVIGETWRVTELSFTTTKKYVAAKGEQGKVVFDCEFTHKDSGKTLTVPGFWDGNDVFKIRFAPTLYGVWEYKTICATDDELNGKTGTIGANAYKGDLEVYKRGFVKTDAEKKYFIYDDGTPFFYLGDTHWGMLAEEIDSAGPKAGNLQTDSHFKYIVDKRVEQGFTVYQSEPIGAKFSLTDGKINRDDVMGFQEADRYFQYIADKGLVHANAQFFFPTYMSIQDDMEALKSLSRYWVARFGAYPVMWTLAQEIDNDFYYERGEQSHTIYNKNPWVNVAEFINECDAYNHPTTGHQEGAGSTSITGVISDATVSGDGKSVFASEEVTQKTGHDWWASQWGFNFKSPQTAFTLGKEYWASNKVGVMYEGKYCYLWTKNFGSRAQGWLAYLNGFFGYGYGAQDIWNYNSDYSKNVGTSDGYETVTIQDKQMPWSESIELESGYQVGYMRQFFETIEWWNLVPDLGEGTCFAPYYSTDKHYSAASIGNDVYVIYLYNAGKGNSGTICNMDGDATYTIKWFNPRTNEYIEIGTDLKPNTTDANGNPAYQLENKPNRSMEDWVILAVKNK